MGLSAAVGGFNAPASSSAGTQVSVTGLSFQPVVVFLWMTGRTETDDTAVIGNTLSGRSSFGAFGGSSEEIAWGCAHIDNQDTSLYAGIIRNDAVLVQAGGNNDYRTLECASMNADGFTVQIGSAGTNPWAACRVHYLALGGTDVTAVDTGTVSVASGTGNESYTPLAFTPTALVFLNFTNTVNTYRDDDITPLIGAATGPSNQWVWAGNSEDALGTTDNKRYLRTDECAGLMQNDGNSMQARARFVSLDASGWTFNRLEGGAGYTQAYVALGGVTAKAGTFTASSGGGSITGLGFQPTAILFLTHGTTQQTADTPAEDFVWSIGASVTGITQRCAHVHDVDNVAFSEAILAHRDDGVLVTSNTSAAVDSVLAIASHDSDGFTYTMPTSTHNGYLVGYLAFGVATPSTTARSFCAGMIG